MSDFTTPRVSEKKFYAIPDAVLTADATADGLVTIASTFQYKVGMVVSLSSSTQTPRRLKIKRVVSETQMHLGDEKTKITDFVDLSSFLVADTATVRLTEQQRPVIDVNEINRQVYEEEPTVALRSHLVDWLGRSYDTTNPVPVKLSDGAISIGSVNAELEVSLNHKDGDPDSGDVADSVRIGDGTNELRVNPDGSISVGDTLDAGGEDRIVSLSTTPVLAVTNLDGVTPKAARRFVILEALSMNVKWGFSPTSQSFDLFRNQLIMLPVGPNTKIYLKVTTGTGSISVGEVS